MPNDVASLWPYISAAALLIGGAIAWLFRQLDLRGTRVREARTDERKADIDERDADRKSFETLVAQQNATIERQNATIAELSGRVANVEADLLAERSLRMKLEVKIAQYEGIIQYSEDREKALIKHNCRVWRTQPCPRLVELHDPDVTPPKRAPELVGGAGTKE